MIAWVVDVARAARSVDDVAVITDHADIARAAEAAGARAVVDAEPAASGTDRIARLLALDPAAARAGVVVNLQGDEPLLEPAAVDAAVAALAAHPDADIATLARPRRPGEDPADPGLVKVDLDADGRARAFSRAPLGGSELVHVGLYAYRRAAFDRFAGADPVPAEIEERLEQLRALALGLAIVCVRFDSRAVAVDRPEDLARVASRLDSEGPGT